MSTARLLAAVRQLDLATAKRLLTANPSLIVATDRRGFSLLHLACSVSPGASQLPDSAPMRMADYLLRRGLDLEAAVGPDRCTPLFFAVQRARHPALVRMLIDRGASPRNAPGHGLFAAAWWGDRPIIRLLLRAGADIDVVVGMTPFLGSWCWRRFDGAKALAERGANVNFQDPKTGRTALHYGIQRGFDPALIGWLVKRGASADVADRSGVTPGELASRKRDKAWLAALS